MQEIYDISFLDELGDEVGQSQIKAEPNITSESQMNTHASVQEALDETLPNKSYSKYVSAYEALKKWQESKEVNSFAEPVLLNYFRELSEKCKPSSLWAMYSMLRSTILCNHNIHISEYRRLKAFLKQKSEGYQSKKSKVFTVDEVNKFLMEAPDEKYLQMKTILVFALVGTCSEHNITTLKIDQVKDNGNEIIVRIPDAKTRIAKAYVIDGQFAEIVRRYMKLRPIRATTERFFIQLLNGKCTMQVIGKNKISKFPKEIAKFLKLPESESYTGNTFRIMSKRNVHNGGIGVETRIRYGDSKCTKYVEGNVQESLGHKRKMDTPIAEEINSPLTSGDIIPSHENASKRIATDTITNCESCLIKQEEIIDDPLSLSERVSSTDTSDNSSASESEAPRHKRKKRPKRQKEELYWYDEECLSQIKLTTDMFKRFSKLDEGDKMKMLSEFSMHRVELFQKYFLAINPTNTSTTAASTNTSSQNGDVANPALVNSLNNTDNTNNINNK